MLPLSEQRVNHGEIRTIAGKPAFLITIDTEGDNLWRKGRAIRTDNTKYLPRFQQLCERYGFKPTWLTAYEMVEDPAYVEFAKDVVRRGAGEVGMHLHPWNSPPLKALTEDDLWHHPYLIEYPREVVVEKLEYITRLLEERFERKMLSHRAGRWAMNSHYARQLVRLGYKVDCSVTPKVSWQSQKGVPGGAGGSDYRSYPSLPYFMDLERLDRPGDSELLQVPVSIAYTLGSAAHSVVGRAPRLARKLINRVMPTLIWLRPNGHNLRWMQLIVIRARLQSWPCVEFMLHSSELMPGGSPIFKTEAAIERLYRDLERLFADARHHFRGQTLTEFYRQVTR